jgi:radical SAM superfamily enzyme YgiQ (UPF0313 family)
MNAITVLNFSPQFNNTVSFPYTYALFKHYYEVNGVCEYQWIDPKYLKQDTPPSEVAEWLASKNLKFLFASLYVWNFSYTHLVLEEYKKLNKETVIVLGGPHVFPGLDYFLNYPWVDLCCDNKIYGEVFIKELLDGNNWREVTGAIWKTGRSTKTFSIRDFEWAPSPYSNSIDFGIEISSSYKTMSMQLETSRGCPFKCTFCEWGGGIGTKMNKRQLTDIKRDIDAMVTCGVDTLQICDSNFGFWEEDVEVIKHIAQYKKAVGLPKYLEIYGWSKNNHKHHYSILKEMKEAGFTQHYAVSLQSVKEETLKNIKRSDIPTHERIKFAKKIQDELGCVIQFEFILGLPGDTIDDYYDLVNLRHDFKDFISFVWWMLPNTESYTPEYREKFKLLTAWSETVDADCESNKKPHIWEKSSEKWEYVMGSYSLTPTEWLEGFLLDRFYITAKHNNCVWARLEETRNQLRLTPSEFWKHVMKSIPVIKQGGWDTVWEEAFPQLQQLIVPSKVNKNLFSVELQGKECKFFEFADEFYNRALDEIVEFVRNQTNTKQLNVR